MYYTNNKHLPTTTSFLFSTCLSFLLLPEATTELNNILQNIFFKIYERISDIEKTRKYYHDSLIFTRSSMSVNPRFFRFAVIFFFSLIVFLRVKRHCQLIHECYGYIIPHKCDFSNPFSEKKLIFFTFSPFFPENPAFSRLTAVRHTTNQRRLS